MPWISRMRSGAMDKSCSGVSIPPLISTAVVRGLNPQSANGRCPLTLAARRFIRTPRQQRATAPKGDNIEADLSGRAEVLGVILLTRDTIQMHRIAGMP